MYIVSQIHMYIYLCTVCEHVEFLQVSHKKQQKHMSEIKSETQHVRTDLLFLT